MNERQRVDRLLAGRGGKRGGSRARSQRGHRRRRVQPPGDRRHRLAPLQRIGGRVGDELTPQHVLLVARADAERLEVPAILAVERLGQRVPDVATAGVGQVGQRERDLAPHGRRRIRRRRARGREHIARSRNQRAERGRADVLVGIVQVCRRRLRAVVVGSSEQPQRARPEALVACGGGLLERRHRARQLVVQRLPSEPAHVHGGTVESVQRAVVADHVVFRLRELRAARRDAQDAPVRFAIAGQVTADARIPPVRDEDRSVGADGDVARAEPAFFLGVALAGDRREEHRRLEVEARAVLVGDVRVHAVAPRVRVEHGAVELRAEEVALVHDDAGRSARAVDRAGRDDARIVLVPVRDRRRLPRPPVGVPIARSVGREVAVVAALHHEQRATARVAVVVVVRLPHVPERIERDLVVVAEVVREDAQVRAVGVDAQDETAGPDVPIVAHHARRVVGVVLAAAAVDRARAQRPARLVLHDVRAGVAGVEPPAPVGAGDERVQPVIVVVAAEPGEQHLAPIGLVVAVEVGVNVRRGRAGDDHFVADHGDAERCDEVLVLHEHLGRVAHAVAVGVLEDHHAIAFGSVKPGVAALPLAVVHRLRDPHAPARVDVHRGGVEELRRLGPQRDREAVLDHEVARDVARAIGLRRVLRARRRCLRSRAGREQRGDRSQEPVECGGEFGHR